MSNDQAALLPIYARFCALIGVVVCPLDPQTNLPVDGGLARVERLSFGYFNEEIPVMEAVIRTPQQALVVVQALPTLVEPLPGKLAFTFEQIGSCHYGNPIRQQIIQQLRGFLLGIPAGIQYQEA